MKCLFKIYDGRKSFWQWDTGQKLIVLDERIDQVHFATKGMTHALVTEVYQSLDGVRICNVPDIILQIPKTVIAYAYLNELSERSTLISMQFSVKERPIPDDYVMNQDAEIGQLDERVLALEDKVGDKKVVDRINEVIGNAPDELNTLEEIAKAIGNDPDFIENMKINFDRKVDKIEGKGLSENDFTNKDKEDLQNSIKKSEVDQVFDPVSAFPQSGVAVKKELDKKVDKVSGMGLSHNDFTDELKIKLDAIESDATKVEIDESLTQSKKAADAKAVGDALKEKLDIKNHIPDKILGTDENGNVIDMDAPNGIVYQPEPPLDTNVLWVDTDDNTNPSRIIVDPTLKVDGDAADAKITGDRIKELDTNKLNKNGFTPNKYLGTDEFGNIVEKEAPSGGGTIEAEGKEDAIIITTSLSVKGDGDSIIIG